ncbi:hypothetical protein HOG98_08770, partial [bacterium]|nr:hypothetical protein [bacterium]
YPNCPYALYHSHLQRQTIVLFHHDRWLHDCINCPAGIATQNPELRKKLKIDDASKKLTRFFNAATDLMKILTRACGHNHLNKLNRTDLTTWKKEMHELSGVPFSGISSYK